MEVLNTMKVNPCCSTTFGTEHASTCDNYKNDWELKIAQADERLAQANRDGIEDSWHEEPDE